MKNAKKIMLLVLCAALLVGATVAGTVAYLTSQAEVKNTFTVGKVEITMDEAKVDEYGKPVAGEDRVDTNEYLLVPGHTYTKDPTVYVKAKSEDCYVFVKVENGLANYEAVENTIHDQILANGWKELDATNHPGVYYKEHVKAQTDVELDVFGEFTIATTHKQGEDWSAAAKQTIVVTAYAIQKDTMGSAADAWTKLTTQLNPPVTP